MSHVKKTILHYDTGGLQHVRYLDEEINNLILTELQSAVLCSSFATKKK